MSGGGGGGGGADGESELYFYFLYPVSTPGSHTSLWLSTRGSGGLCSPLPVPCAPGSSPSCSGSRRDLCPFPSAKYCATMWIFSVSPTFLGITPPVHFPPRAITPGFPPHAPLLPPQNVMPHYAFFFFFFLLIHLAVNIFVNSTGLVKSQEEYCFC